MATNAAPNSGAPRSTAAAVISAPAAGTDNKIVLFPGAQPRKLSETLEQLITEFHTRRVTLREVIVVLQGRAYNLLMLLLAMPFLLPLPLPGLSTVLGTVIAVIALRLTLGQKPWLPARLLDRELPPKFFPTLLNGTRRVLRFLEVLLKPRLLWLTASPQLNQLHAFVILLASFVLLLPLPPGTNFPPAVCIVIMAGGLLERDGRFILAGYLALAINGVFFTLLAQLIWGWITGLWAHGVA
jgi:hypothetical protein